MKKIAFLFIWIGFGVQCFSQLQTLQAAKTGIAPRFLREHLDVSFRSLASGDALIYNGSGWTNTPLVGASTQVMIGTGTGLTSYSNFTFDNSTSIATVTGATNPRIRAVQSTTNAAYLEAANSSQTWQFYVNGNNGGIEPNVADGQFAFRNLANTELLRIITASGVIDHRSGTTTRITGKGGTGLGLAGYDTNEALTTISLGSNLQISAGALSINTTNLAGSFFAVGGNSLGATAATFGTNDVRPLHFETNNTRRFSIPSSGIANTPSSTKALVLSSTDSLGYTTLQSSDWTNTVTQSGSDTLLNAAAGYGHFQRIGNVVSFTLRVEIALTSAGDANTVYIDPPIASNFTTAASDVIGTATMDPQSLSGANTQRQRCVVFASDSDEKIGISFDPVASLAYPENRMYISVSGSYVVQ